MLKPNHRNISYDLQGFGEADVEATAQKKKKTAVLSDDEDEGAATGEQGGTQILPELSDDENEEAARKSGRGGEGDT